MQNAEMNGLDNNLKRLGAATGLHLIKRRKHVNTECILFFIAWVMALLRRKTDWKYDDVLLEGESTFPITVGIWQQERRVFTVLSTESNSL